MALPVLLLVFLLGSLGSAYAGELCVGAASVNITPPAGIGLAGYYFDRGAKGTHDDLFAKALVLEEGGERAALVTLDLISVTRLLVEDARREIEKSIQIRGDHVMISATHAHTGPVLAHQDIHEDPEGGSVELSRQYTAALPQRIVECVRLAQSRLKPAGVSAAIGREEHLSYNRRFHMKDGTVGWNPGKLNPNIVKPAGPIDPEVGVALFESPQEKEASIPLATYVNFAMHPDTVGGEYFSADYPGVLSHLLSDYKGKDMITLFANGTCGNINHLDVTWPDPQHGNSEATRIGAILAAAVLQAYKQAQPVKVGPLRARSEMVPLPLPEINPAEVEKARAVVERYGTKDNSGFMEKVQAYKVLDIAARKGKPLEAEVQVIALGDQIAWVSLPGEIFVELGLAIKKGSPFKYTFIAELANGSLGYIPNRSAYAEGNYEVVSARCAEGSGERLVDAALKLLNELKK